MAAHERLSFQTSIAHHSLADKLAKALPTGTSLKIYHVSTPPSRCPALYSAPPGERPDRTYCESHFLTASISTNIATTKSNLQQGSEVLIFALEVLIYSTAYSTTFFISKADSTGYLKLLNLPKGTPSPLKDISATFLSHLVEGRNRPGVRNVVSLFARAQGQYLFPGSSENKGKHVLDDRELIRWWCRVLDPLVENDMDNNDGLQQSPQSWSSIRGYLKVPGLDNHETRSYLPNIKAPSSNVSWAIGHPLQELSGYQPEVLPRCFIPRFPDDPKSRFLDELDDELSTSEGKGNSGKWKSVKTLDQFWEMMAFRQECSAGRLVGFIWVVFEPPTAPQTDGSTQVGSQASAVSRAGPVTNGSDVLRSFPDVSNASSTPNIPIEASSQITPKTSPLKTRPVNPVYSELEETLKRPKPVKKHLSGPVIPRQPRIKTHNRNYALERPENTAYYFWPPNGRGQIVLDEKDYTRMTELLLRLDFANIDLATGSTERWISEVRSGALNDATNKWGTPITGIKAFEVKSEDGKSGIRTLNVGLVRKKRKVMVTDTANQA